MDEVERSCLRQHRVFFVQTVDVRHLFSPLIQDNVLTADDCEFIQSQGRTRMEKAEVFLDMVVSKGPNAFVSLCRALKPRYGLVLQRLGLTADEMAKLEDSNGSRVRRSSSVGDLLSCQGPNLADFSLHYASERLQEQIELLNVVQKERDSLLSQLAERNQDAFELNQVRAFQKTLEETNERLQRDRDSALELAAQMKGQCDIIRAQYQEARSTVHHLTAELQSQSKGTEAVVLQRICSEVSAKFEMEKANHMKTQLELNEVKARCDRVTRELESLEELKQTMTTNIKELTGSLKKSQAENVLVSHMMQSASLKCFNTAIRPNVMTQDVEGKLHQQIALLRCEKRQLEEQSKIMEHELKQLREHYNTEKHKKKQMMIELDDATQQQMTTVKQHDAVIDQYNTVCKYAHKLWRLLNDVKRQCQNAEAHCQDLKEDQSTVEVQLQKMVIQLEQLQNELESSNKELAKERREKIEALKVCMAHENKMSDKKRENKKLKAQLKEANEMKKSVGFENAELKKNVQIVSDRLAVVREKVNDFMETMEDTDSLYGICARNWKMQCSDCEITVNSKVMPALSVESALYVVGGGSNSLTPGLRKGDRIIKVNNVAVDKLPACCLRDNILVPPTDSVTSNYTLTVQRMTPPSCEELLTVLQEPPPKTIYWHASATQWSKSNSPCSTQESSPVLISSVQSGPYKALQKQSFIEGDDVCPELLDGCQPNQNHQHVKQTHQPDQLAFTCPSISTSLNQFSYQTKPGPVTKSNSLPVSAKSQWHCSTFQLSAATLDQSVTDQSVSCFRDRNFPFPLLPKYSETGLLNLKNWKLPIPDTLVEDDEHSKTVTAGSAGVRGFQLVADEEKSVNSTETKIVSVNGVSLDENATRGDTSAATSHEEWISQVEMFTSPNQDGTSVTTSREEWISQVKKMVTLPSQDRDQRGFTNASYKEVLVLCDGGGDSGIALVGGRGHGLFISSIEAGSSAARSGLLHQNDEIVKVNGKDMTMATYEEGILALKSCPETVALAVQENYNKLNVMPSWSKRDTFFVRSLFSTNGNIGLNFSCGDILCVLDTIYEDQVGNWYACKLSETGHIIGEGCIPNIQRASKLLDSLAGSSLQHESPFKRPRSKAVIGQRGQLHSTDCDVRKNQSRIGGLKECPVKCSVIYDSDIIGYRVATSAMTLFLSETIVEQFIPDEDLKHSQFICNSSGVTVPVLEKAASLKYHCVLSGTPEESIQRLVSFGLHPIVIYLDPKSARKISSITGASDTEAQSLMALAQKERKGLISAGILSAQLQSRGQLKKTVDLTVDLVKVLQEALYWLPSKVQF